MSDKFQYQAIAQTPGSEEGDTATAIFFVPAPPWRTNPSQARLEEQVFFSPRFDLAPIGADSIVFAPSPQPRHPDPGRHGPNITASGPGGSSGGSSFPGSGLDMNPSIPDSPYLGDKQPLIPRDPNADKRTRDHVDKLTSLTNSLIRKGQLHFLGAGNWEIVAPQAHAAARAPNANDDISGGFQKGQSWIDTVAGRVYFCVNNALGAAVWNGPY